MDRAERLRAFAQDISQVWGFDSRGETVIATSALDTDETKLRLSWDEYEGFLRDSAQHLLQLVFDATDQSNTGSLLGYAANHSSPVSVLDDVYHKTLEVIGEIKQLTVFDTCVTSVLTDIMTIDAPWETGTFTKPELVAPQMIHFATPVRLPVTHLRYLARSHGGLSRYLMRQTDENLTALCRGVLRVDEYVHVIYTFHPTDGPTKMVCTSEYQWRKWVNPTSAILMGFLEWLGQRSSAHIVEKGEQNTDFVPLHLVEINADEIGAYTVGYADHLAEQNPKTDGHIQSWLRRREFGVPPGTVAMGPVDRHTAAVNLYLETTKILIEISQKKDVDDFYRQAAARIRLATIYEVDASLFRQLLTKSKPLVDSLMERHSGTPEQRLYEAAKGAAPIPETRPFDDMFVALSRPVRLDQYPEVTSRIFGQIRGRPTWQVWCEAVFVTRDFPLLVFQAEPPHRELLSLWTDHWEGGDTLMPWALPWLIRLLYEHDARVIPQQTGRVRYQTRAKKLRVPARTPPPYYAVTLRAHHLSPVTGGAGPRSTEVEWHHRWHVQAHERAYISRGPLPLALTDREAMLRNGYQVFEREVDQRCREALERRSKSPKRYDEWLAIKYVRVSEAIKPDRPDLPLVPSTRRVRNLSV